MEALLAVLLFAISSSITPGPNNIMVMTSGVNFGWRKSIPLLVGICFGFAVMLIIVGFGFGELFEVFPALQLWIKCLGTVYLIYLSLLIACSHSELQSDVQQRPLTFLHGALFQWVNAKAWVVAMGAIVAFTNSGADYVYENMLVAAVFLAVGLPCVGVWLVFGVVLKKYLSSSVRQRYFNYTMAGLLLLSVVPVCLDIMTQLTSG
ncbi:lysine transporter LysE [Pseudoalteromonas sp. MSK9-3]|uniref:LysE family translocator n=1 Tax=Pseudoalteromonas sp. MSK9-3 TaxID=1897633 RepID=UPI000E6BE5A1|nr:LysE family translocator [Pseudoalteromonas sp. MSK9-3]RJE77567.1 lysine transporter LysE [Pseudoalteromonas sp. MSK9-3]